MARDDRPLFDGLTILAVFAHPDDESLACGGTLARLADAGARVVLLCASHGERGSLAGPIRDDALGVVRAQELGRAADALGISRVLVFDHPDGDLRWARVTELSANIEMAIRRFRPAAVITFGADGLYWHVDHIGIHERTTTVVQSLGAGAPPLYYVTMRGGAMLEIAEHAVARGWTTPASGFWSLPPGAFGLGAVPPTIIVDVADWTSRKLAAIRCHRSQMEPGNPFEGIDGDNARRWLGIEQFRRAPTAGTSETVLERIGEAALSN